MNSFKLEREQQIYMEVFNRFQEMRFQIDEHREELKEENR
jgi:hypothetical protein